MFKFTQNLLKIRVLILDRSDFNTKILQTARLAIKRDILIKRRFGREATTLTRYSIVRGACRLISMVNILISRVRGSIVSEIAGRALRKYSPLSLLRDTNFGVSPVR